MRVQYRHVDAVFNLSYEKYKAAIARNPKAYWVMNNWSLTMKTRAQKYEEMDPSPERAEATYEEATALARQAVGMHPQSATMQANLGRIIVEQSVLLDDAAAKRALFDDAIAQCEMALKKGRDEAILNAVGRAYREKAELLEGEERIKLLEVACERLNEALRIGSGNKNTTNNYGVSLMAKGAHEPDPLEKARIFHEARDLFLLLPSPAAHEAERVLRRRLAGGAVGEGEGAGGTTPRATPLLGDDSGDDNDAAEAEDDYWWAYYSLARLYALSHEHDEARLCLELYFERDRLSPRMLTREAKFDAVRALPWFTDLLARAAARQRERCQAVALT